MEHDYTLSYIHRGNVCRRCADVSYGVSYQQIYAWVRKYEEKGVAGLVDGRGRNKPESEMTEVEKLRVQNKLLQAQIKDKEMEIALLKKLKELERWDV